MASPADKKDERMTTTPSDQNDPPSKTDGHVDSKAAVKRKDSDEEMQDAERQDERMTTPPFD